MRHGRAGVSSPRGKTAEQCPRCGDRAAFRTAGLLAVLVLIVLAAVWITFRPVLEARAISFDDDLYLKDNPMVQRPSWASAGRILGEILEPSKVNGYYQPLSIITIMLDYAAGGREQNLRPFHRTSLALHVANTALIIVLMYLLFSRSPRPMAVIGDTKAGTDRVADEPTTGALWAAAMVGLLFGLHPLTVEPVAWVGERKTALAAFFSLGCLILYVRYARTGRWKYYGLALAAFVLGLLSKPSSTPLPVLLLLLDFWPLRRLGRRAVLEKVPFFIAACASAVVTVISCAWTSGVEVPTGQAFGQMPLKMCHHIVVYLYRILWPVNLSLAYPPVDPATLSNPAVQAGLIGVVLLLAVMLISLRWTRAIAVGGLFFFAAIFPTLGVLGYSWVSMADKYVYLPAIGLLAVAAAVLTKLWMGWPGLRPSTARQVVLVVLVLSLAGGEAVATRNYLANWKDSVTLYEHMLAIAPGIPMLHHDIGLALAQRGRVDEAIGHYNEALRIRPGYPEAHNNLAVEYIAMGKYDLAVEHGRAAIALRPNYARGQYNLAVALLQRGDVAEAMEHLEQALRIRPGFAEAHNNLGVAWYQKGRIDEAAKHFAEAVRLKDDYLDAHYNLARVLDERGQLNGAIEHYRHVLRLDPNRRQARTYLDAALARQKG